MQSHPLRMWAGGGGSGLGTRQVGSWHETRYACGGPWVELATGQLPCISDRKMAEREEALQSSSGSYGSEAEPEKDTAYEYLCRLEEAKK